MSNITVTVDSNGDISTALVGIVGPQGATGATGPGVPTGGTTGQFLRKSSGTDFDTAFATITSTTVGLGSVDNTADVDKPVSSAQSAAIAVVQADIDAHEANTSNPHSVTATQVGLGNVNNTSDANKPVSTAQATAIGVVQSDIDAHEANTSNPHSVTASQVGLGNVDNTSDANKPISTATQTALDLKAPLASPALTGTPTAPTAAQTVSTTQLATTAFVQARGFGALPSGVVVDYANRCSVLPQIDGLLMASFDTSVTAYRNIAGGFNGGGRGNKSFICFNNFNGISFGNLTSLKFVAKNFNGATNLMFFNIMVDLVGSGLAADTAILIPKASNLFITGSTNTEQSVASSGDVWAAVGGTGAAGGSPLAGKPGIPGYIDQTAPFCSLAHIMTYNPNAKFLNVALLDGGQPKNANMGAIQVVMGSSGTEAYSRNSLFSATVGISGVETLYQFGAI